MMRLEGPRAWNNNKQNGFINRPKYKESYLVDTIIIQCPRSIHHILGGTYKDFLTIGENFIIKCSS